MIIELPVLPGASALRHFRLGFFHFSNNNLAVRRECADDVGRYDPRMRTSEDVDLCFRIARDERWAACREPGVVVRHRNRRTVPAMIKQLWGWGINAGRAYRKTGIRGVHLYWVSPRARTITRALEIDRFPWLVAGFFNPFHLAHLLALAALVGVLAGHSLTAAVTGALSLMAFIPFLTPLFARRLGPWMTAKLIVVAWIAHAAFMSASFIGGLRAGILFIPAPMFPTRSPEGQEAILEELAT